MLHHELLIFHVKARPGLIIDLLFMNVEKRRHSMFFFSLNNLEDLYELVRKMKKPGCQQMFLSKAGVCMESMFQSRVF